jgi:hypothetical protein
MRMLSLRLSAPTDFLARRLAMIDWRGVPPREGSRWWLVETCRAELEWAEADWRRLGGDALELPRSGRYSGPISGPHPAEACRLPHEEAAARLVNCHLHVDVEAWRIRELLRRLPGQRQAAGDLTQSAAYRASWAAVAAGAIADLGDHRKRRAQAWRAFLAAASLYCRLRGPLDRSAAIGPRAIGPRAIVPGARAAA